MKKAVGLLELLIVLVVIIVVYFTCFHPNYGRSNPFDDNVKKNGHGVGMSQHGANNLAKQGYNAYQILQYFYQNVKFAKLNN